MSSDDIPQEFMKDSLIVSIVEYEIQAYFRGIRYAILRLIRMNRRDIALGLLKYSGLSIDALLPVCRNSREKRILRRLGGSHES